MIRCLVVDDEDLARLHLRRLLQPHSDFQIIGDAASGLEAVETILESNPDVVFLDIEMPGFNGFEVVSQLSNPPLIVFATAYDKYAVDAFDANALDYLLKPIQPGRLAQAVEKIRTTLNIPRPHYASALRRAISKLQVAPPAKLAARRGKRIVLLSPSEILYIAVEGELVFLHNQTERFVSDRTIAELEELLGGAGFLRISRSAIVNLTHARELLPWFSGRWKVKLSNNTELLVSRGRARQLKSRIG